MTDPREPRPDLSRSPVRRPGRSVLKPGVEYEFQRLTLARDLSRSFVTRLLTERAEYGGWELDRVRILPDGTRKVVLRRKIIRQLRTTYVA